MCATATATPRSRQKSGFYISVTCPGCGSKLELGDNLFVLICYHCGSHLRLEMPDVPPAYLVKAGVKEREIRFGIDRYLKENGHPLTGPELMTKRIYYPYWKIDGILLKVRNRIEKRVVGAIDYSNGGTKMEEETETRNTEVSLNPFVNTIAAGPLMDEIPYSIGLRAEYLSMVPYSSDKVDDSFISQSIMIGYDKALESARHAVIQVGNVAQADFGRNKTELLRPEGSLVYFPYVVAECYAPNYYRFIVDGLSGHVIHFTKEPPSLEQSVVTGKPQVELGELKITRHACYNCGEDLPRGRSHIYICANCFAVNSIDKRDADISEIEFVAQSAETPDRQFPFWVFPLSEDEQSKIKSLFGGIYGSGSLAIPAFKLPNFEAAYRLTKRVSASVGQLETEPVREFHERFRAVSLSQAEARMLAEVMIYRARIKREARLTAAEVSFDPGAARIVYLPFHEEAYFYVDSVLNAVTFEKSLIP